MTVVTEPRAMTWTHWLANQAAATAMECVGTVRLLDLPEPEYEELWEKGACFYSLPGFPQTATEDRHFDFRTALKKVWPNVTFILPE